MAAGPLAGALTIAAGSFHLIVKFTLDAASCGTDFEFGVDIFTHKSEGSPEAMCIQIASPERYKLESSKSGFALDCKDQGDGTWTPGSSPVIPHSVPAPKCTGPAPAPAPGCKLNWFYCPRDPGCVGYSMSAETVDVTVDDSSIAAGDMVVMNVTGTTTLKAVPLSSTYKVRDQISLERECSSPRRNPLSHSRQLRAFSPLTHTSSYHFALHLLSHSQ